MSIPYLVRKKRSALKGERKTLWYAIAKKLQPKGGKNEKDIAWEVHHRSGFQKGVVLGVLAEVAIVMEEMLKEGNSVTIPGIGTFQVALTSDGFEKPEDVLPGQVRVSRVYYIADRLLTRTMKETKFIRIPLSSYFPKEMLSKKVLEEENEVPPQEG